MGFYPCNCLFFFGGLDQHRCYEYHVWVHLDSKKREITATERGKESRKYIGCGDMIAGERSQGPQVVKEIPHSETVQMVQRCDTLGVQYAL